MPNMYQNMKAKNPNAPKRLGDPWDDLEIAELLSEVKAGKSYDEMASQHERTSGSIRARLREIAANLHLKEKRTIQECCNITGLTKDEVIDAINKKEYRESQKKQKKIDSKKVIVQPDYEIQSEDETALLSKPASEMGQVLELLKDIKNLLQDLVSQGKN
jgi:hypothetical protein